MTHFNCGRAVVGAAEKFIGATQTSDGRVTAWQKRMP